MFVRKFALLAVSLCTIVSSTPVQAVEFKSLECASITFDQAPTYNVNVPCTAVVRQGGAGMWYNAPGQECSAFCRAIASTNVSSPDGFSCTSGEERPLSAIGVVNYAPTGCWHDCRLPEGRPGAVSIGSRCYAPGQKRDNDRTDTTVGCFCATGDSASNEVDVGIHASGTAQSAGVTHWVTGLTNLTAATMNDRPGRVSYIRGGISLSGEAVVRFVVNVQGACGTSIAMSGRTNGSGGTSSSSSEITIAFPACARECSDGADNDGDGASDSNDFSCIASRGQSEAFPQAACQNGIDDDGDGATDAGDSGCDDAQDTAEDGGETACDLSVDHTAALGALEETIRAQRIVVYELVDPIIKTAADAATTAKAKEFRILADTIKRELVRDMSRRYPKTTQQCPDCTTQDLSSIKMDFVLQSRRMMRLTRQVAVFARTATPGLVVRGPLQTAESLFQKFRSSVGALPGQTSQCSE
jgi:hypothetical protein